MNSKWRDIGSLVFLAVAWGLAGFTTGYTGLFTESPDEAFVRGFFHGAYHAVSVVDGKLNQNGKLILSYREGFIQDSNILYQEWLGEIDEEQRRDSLAAIPDSIYFDPTDTMPAVEDTTYVDTFYKRDGVWRSDDTDED